MKGPDHVVYSLNISFPWAGGDCTAMVEQIAEKLLSLKAGIREAWGLSAA